MDLTVLVDNNCRLDRSLFGEQGLSILLEDDVSKILFDCGQSDMFIKNAYNIGIDLADVSGIVLSNGYRYHTGGLLRLDALYRKMLKTGLELNLKKIYAHLDTFESKLNSYGEEIGFPGDTADLCELFDFEFFKEPRWISQNLLFLGEIPKYYNTDYKYKDETALVYKSEKGISLIVGCSYVGLKNIIEYAKKVTQENKIDTIIGGIYLSNKTEYKIRELGVYLKNLNIKNFYPCHCCDLNSKIILSEYIKIKEVYSGLNFSLN